MTNSTKRVDLRKDIGVLGKGEVARRQRNASGDTE
jgi:hypothetical protein